MINPLENKEILSDEIFSCIKIILENCPNAVFGGSICLNAFGLINRKINDIDIFIAKNQSYVASGILSKSMISNVLFGNNLFSDTITDVNGKNIPRTGISFTNEIKCCVFKVDDEELMFHKYILYGKEIKLQYPKYAVMAKLAYSNKTEKHKEDLKQIIPKLFETKYKIILL